MKKSAFTLIELLVVITIIAILAGIALPVFGKVLEKSRATNDASNLNQLGLGVAAYLNDNDETIFSDKDTGAKAWPKVLQEKYVTNWKVFKCPFDKRPDANGDAAPVSYGVNQNVLTQPGKPGWDGSFSKLVAPSQLILMAPEMTKVTSVPTFDPANVATKPVSLTQRGAGKDKLGTHNGRALINALFADSHVSTLKFFPNTDPDAFTSDQPEKTGTLTGMVVKWEPVAKAP